MDGAIFSPSFDRYSENCGDKYSFHKMRSLLVLSAVGALHILGASAQDAKADCIVGLFANLRIGQKLEKLFMDKSGL